MNYYCENCDNQCSQDIYEIPTYDNDLLSVNICSDFCLTEIKKEVMQEDK